MLRTLAAEGTGCLLRLEGLHRADEDTLAVVEYLAGSAADAPVLVTVSVRPGAVEDRRRGGPAARGGRRPVAGPAPPRPGGRRRARRRLPGRRPGCPGARNPLRGPAVRGGGDAIEAGRPERAARTLLDLARRDAARGALRSAEKRLTQAADAAGDSRLENEVLRERVSVLTLVGRAAEALELGAARLGLVTGDAHAERAGSPEALCEALGVAGAPPCPGSPSPSPPSPTRTAGCGRPTGSVRGPPSSSGRTGSSPGATTGRPGDRATALAGAVGLSPGRGARAQAA